MLHVALGVAISRTRAVKIYRPLVKGRSDEVGVMVGSALMSIPLHLGKERIQNLD